MGFISSGNSAASVLYAERGDLKQTQEFFGSCSNFYHADVYTHVDDKILEDGVEALAHAIWPGPIEVEGPTGFNERNRPQETAKAAGRCGFYCGLIEASFAKWLRGRDFNP